MKIIKREYVYNKERGINLDYFVLKMSIKIRMTKNYGEILFISLCSVKF